MFKKEKIPEGIRILTWSTSVRWFGWGLGEAFVPIFLLSFSENFSETGLLASIYNITFFLSIPFAGYLADNIKIRSMILAGLIIYIFIGLGYFLAGATGAIIFIVIARGLNGIAYSLDQVGRESYFIRHYPEDKISKIFGKFDVITNFWWIIAVFAYLNGDGLVNSTILALVYAMPILFGKILGKIADEKRENIYFISFSFVVLILVSLMFTKNYFLLLIIMFLSSAIFELISLTNKGMIARFADRTHLGEIDGSLNGVSAVGAVVGPLLFGFLLDSISQPNAYLFIVSISAVALLVSFWGTKKCFQVR